MLENNNSMFYYVCKDCSSLLRHCKAFCTISNVEKHFGAEYGVGKCEICDKFYTPNAAGVCVGNFFFLFKK